MGTIFDDTRRVGQPLPPPLFLSLTHTHLQSVFLLLSLLSNTHITHTHTYKQYFPFSLSLSLSLSLPHTHTHTHTHTHWERNAESFCLLQLLRKLKLLIFISWNFGRSKSWTCCVFQPVNACACVCMVEKDKKHFKIIKNILFYSCVGYTHVRLR